MTVYALNGLGRIGKLALKPLLERGARIAWINDAVGDPAMHSHLFEFDTVHGRWKARTLHTTLIASPSTVTRLPFIGTRDISELPLDGVDVVIDCTGRVQDQRPRSRPTSMLGVKEGGGVSAGQGSRNAANIVYGVNEGTYDPDHHRIVTAASPARPTASLLWSR